MLAPPPHRRKARADTERDPAHQAARGARRARRKANPNGHLVHRLPHSDGVLMSSFFASAPAQSDVNAIGNNGFFPDIDVDVAMVAMRQDGTVTTERLRAALVEAVLSVNEDLEGWASTQKAAGINTLADVPAKKVDGKSAHIHRYLRAVYCEARAGLIERYRDYDATADGDRKAEALMQAVEDLRRDARWAVSDIVGRQRSTVELI